MCALIMCTSLYCLTHRVGHVHVKHPCEHVVGAIGDAEVIGKHNELRLPARACASRSPMSARGASGTSRPSLGDFVFALVLHFPGKIAVREKSGTHLEVPDIQVYTTSATRRL